MGACLAGGPGETRPTREHRLQCAAPPPRLPNRSPVRLHLAAWLAIVLLTVGSSGCRKAAEPAFPTGVVSGMNRGVSLMGQYLYDDAVKAFEEVVRVAPDLTEARINLAIAQFNRNRKEDLDAARQQLAGVLRQDPGNVRALYFNAIVLQHVGQAGEAVPALEQVVRARPEDGAAWYLLGLCKQRVNQPAETEFQQAVRHRPYLYSAYYQLYQAARRAGDEVKAGGYLDQFKRLRDSPLGETIELPQYNQMGDLALALPVPRPQRPAIASSSYRTGTAREILSLVAASASRSAPGATPPPLGGAAFADLDRNGQLDALLPGLDRSGPPVPFRYSVQPGGGWIAAPTNTGPALPAAPLACAVGDFDNDDVPDVFVAGVGCNQLFRGSTNGTFVDVSLAAGITRAGGTTRSAWWLDADHDGDLDLFVCNSGAPNQLFNNNGDGAFTDIATAAGVACADDRSVAVVPGDFDGDRDLDLVVLRDGGAARLFLNELLGRYRESALGSPELRGELGGAAQDLDGDGTLDLLVLGGQPAELRRFRGDGRGHFEWDEAFTGTSRAAASWGPLRGFRLTDVDLDGDLDLACFANEGHLLLNDGTGRFVLRARVWTAAPGMEILGAELADLNGDLVPDLWLCEGGATVRVSVVPGELSPPSTALAVQPSGIRSRDGRTRSPGSGFGASLTARAGLREQRVFHAGQFGSANQSLLPVVLGLAGAGGADYVNLAWPDGVAQVETALAAGQVHKVAELQRKISSCPVLFAWNGTRFEFITDFAGVGGLGYFTAPGVSAPPQVLEHVKIEPGQLRARNGIYELRVTEPMEESAYLDRLELLAIDHPRAQPVFPDERLAIAGAAPTHELLVVERAVFPRAATAPDGREGTDQLARVDRVYAYDPPLDRRYLGFCRPHTLELDFGPDLAQFGPGDRLFLFLNGFIEYPYSQTVYAASQSRIGWEPIRVERLDPDGTWQTIVPDAGVPGGMARMMTIDLTGLVPSTTRKLRLTTNLEVSYDQVFVARHAGLSGVTVHSVPLRAAALRRVGFPREYSPDGRLPLLYDYELSDVTAPFHVLKGAYTRYGPVEDLLADFDDRQVVMGPGDEVALEFAAAALPSVPAGAVRSFVLVSHAYCKDMDLYTATPQTLAPLPFRAMSRYPYPNTESFPDTPAMRESQATYQTRSVE